VYGWQSWQQQQRLWQTASQVRDYLVLLRDDANWHNRNRLVKVGQRGGGWCLSAEEHLRSVRQQRLYAAPALAGSGAQPYHAGIRFYGLRNSAWAGHIRLQSAGGSWNIIVSTGDEFACVVMRRPHRAFNSPRFFAGRDAYLDGHQRYLTDGRSAFFACFAARRRCGRSATVAG
jgi:prepilin peptidase dependent protein A